MVTIAEYLRPVRHASRSRIYSAYLASFSASAAIFHIFGISIIYAGVIGGVSAAFALMYSAEIILGHVDLWRNELTKIRTDKRTSAEDRSVPEVENNEFIPEDGYSSLSYDEIRHIIKASKKGGKMLRRHLDASYIYNLSRRWNSGEIQREAKRLGLIRYDGHYAIYAENIADRAVIEPKSDTIAGVGGSES